MLKIFSQAKSYQSKSCAVLNYTFKNIFIWWIQCKSIYLIHFFFFWNTTNMLPMNISLQFIYLSSCCLTGCDTMHHPAACLGGNRGPQKRNWDGNMRLSALAQGDYHTSGSPSGPGGTFSQQLIKSWVSLTIPLLQLVTCVCVHGLWDTYSIIICYMY